MLPRRHLLALAAGLMQACALWPRRGALAAPTRPAADVPQFCLGLFSDRRDALAVGRRYLALLPGEARSAWLAEQIVQTIVEASDGGSQRAAQVVLSKAAVSAAIRADFVSLDGWLLARTEARICALVALSSGDLGA